MGSLKLTFLGQMGFRIESEGTVLYVDPFLSAHPKRQFPPPIAIEALQDADIILGSHDHKDHIDRAAWPLYAELSPHVRFVVPDLLLLNGLPRELGVSGDRFFGLTHLKSLSLKGVGITAIASAHEFLDKDVATGLYPYLGYVIQVEATRYIMPGILVGMRGLKQPLKDGSSMLLCFPSTGGMLCVMLLDASEI